MISIVIIIILSIFALLLVYLHSTYNYWKRRGVVYETPVPIFGNFKGIGKTHHFRDVNQRLYDKFKGKAPFCGSFLFTTKMALILDLDLLKDILIKDFANFHDRPAFCNVQDDPLTGNLIVLKGDDWRAMRTKLTSVFTSARMKYMYPTILEVGDTFASVMLDIVHSSKNNIIEIKDMCARFTTDVIGTCAFGVECNSLKDPNAEFRNKGKSIFTNRRHHPLIMALMQINYNLAEKLRLKFFPDALIDFFVNVVKQTVEYRLKNNIKRNDFMDLLIEMKAKDSEANKNSKKIDISQGLSIEQMAAQTFVFFLAGFDTSSTTMSFCLYELAKNLDIQEKLRQEILVAIKKGNGALTYEDLNSMEYLEQVIAETLRLYPVLPNLQRVSKNDYQVSGTSLVIEKNILIEIPVSSIHYDPDYFENPLEFNPSRFAAEEIKNRHPMAYLPFGDGPRNCIGARFGKMQAKVGLVALLKQFRFECCPLTEIPLEFDKEHFLVASKNGINLKVTPL